MAVRLEHIRVLESIRIGVVQVVLHSARGIVGTKIGGGTPDPYVGLSISGRGELAKTQYKSNT